MHSQLALTELPSLNLAPFILLDPVHVRTESYGNVVRTFSKGASIKYVRMLGGYLKKQVNEYRGRGGIRSTACVRILCQFELLISLKFKGCELPTGDMSHECKVPLKK